MYKQYVLWSGVFSLAVAAVVSAAPVKNGEPAALKELGPGRYTATVQAIVCGGCGEMIENTLKQQPGIESAAVDSKTKQVSFKVKEGARVKAADLQKALKASSDQMGMGADYQLNDIKKIKPINKENK